jgi:polyisoprenyl-teichoic acid--peptidoglycan teichoic acid transferase
MSKSRLGRKKRRTKRFVRFTFLLVLLFTIGGAAYYAFDIFYSAKQATDNIYEKISSDEQSTSQQNIRVTKDPFTILLVGIENQDGGTGRSDVLMLATVNPRTEEIYMLSIPRDTRTYIPDAGYETKITHSYGIEGISSTIKTVQNMLDVPIDYYITTNFDGFEDVVDTLGGVTVDVPFTFKAQLTGSLKWKTYKEGEMELNGNEALAYVRMRKKDPKGDMGRNERQQQVIRAIIDKGTSFQSITKVDDIMNDLGENVRTDIPPSKFVSFIQLYSKLKNQDIQNLSLKGYDDYIDNVYYYIPDQDSINEISQIITNTLEHRTVVKEDQPSEIENDEY